MQVDDSTTGQLPFGFALAENMEAPSTTTAKPKKSKGKKVLASPWLNRIYHSRQILKQLASPQPNSDYYKAFVNKCWKSSRKESTKERIILMDNLPILDEEKKEELELVSRRTIGDIALVTNIFMPVDPNYGQTKGYALIEIATPSKVENVIKKMHRHKLKSPNINDEVIQNSRASLQSSASSPRGTIKVIPYGDIDKAEDPRIVEFLTSKLIYKGVITPKCLNVIHDIFHTYGSPSAEYLVASQLNAMQTASNGRASSPQELNYLFTNYPSVQVNGEPASTLDGFVKLYERQCAEAPSDTWEEFVKSGYDIDLQRNSFVTVEAALRSSRDWTRGHDSQLMSFLEGLYTECEAASPTQSSVSHVKPVDASQNSSLLTASPLPSLRSRFIMSKELNRELTASLPSVHFGRNHSDSLSYLISQKRDLIFHTTKMEYIYEVLDKTSISGNQPTVNVDRSKMAAKKDREAKNNGEPNVNQTMFGIAYNQLKTTNPTNSCQKKPSGAEPHFAIKIVFKGENVQGEGGPYRQFFTDVSKEMQGTLPLFVPCPNNQQGSGENRDKWVLSPSSDSPLYLSMFEFFGRIMGLSIRTGASLTMDLAPMSWKRLVGQKVDAKDLQQVDVSAHNTIEYLRRCTKEEWEATCPDEHFVTWSSDKTKYNLKKDGESLRVSFDSRQEYADLTERARSNEASIQLKAISAGLSDIIPSPLLSLCTWQDLEWKVCGKPHIDINLLKRHTTCSGVPVDAPHISYFWQTLSEFNQNDRRGFLRFAWAQERLPVNDEEFERTKTRMMIKPFTASGDPNLAFPKADTCFFNIMSPEYSNQKISREKLSFAIYTDSHSMNADEPTEDESTTVNGRRAPISSGSGQDEEEFSSDTDAD